MDEFDLIERFFRWSESSTKVEVGLGDDAAVVDVSAMQRLVLSTDTLVEGVHFPAGFDAAHLGFRLAATNLSDQAAMGATPRFATLNLTMPSFDNAWLKGFSSGLKSGLEEFGCVLVGGDTTKGPLTVSLHISGEVNEDALRRDGACVGDLVFTSGTLGDAAGALATWEKTGRFDDSCPLYLRFAQPTPRLSLGSALRGTATAAIDVSDGLIADLGHVANNSGVGIQIAINQLPISRTLKARFGIDAAREFAASGGDDYELAFTAPATRESDVFAASKDVGVAVTKVGAVVPGAGVVCLNDDAQSIQFERAGHRHF